MDCPKCGTALERSQYEDVPVFQCGSCAGYLIERLRMKMIKISRERTSEILEQEVSQEQQPDNPKLIRCPRCRVERMRKERIRVEPEGEFLLDACRKCSHVWFDGGELARFQLDHEQSQQARESAEMQQRVASRTPEQQEALETRIANLPRHRSWMAEAAADLAGIAVGVSLLIVTIGFWLLDWRVWSGVVSVAFCVFLGWRILRRIESPFSPMVTLLIVAVILGLLELAYLSFLIFS